MADKLVPHFHNQGGHHTIHIGSREFMCIGAEPPFDHPHIYLDMGKDSDIICPYCSTRYHHDAKLDNADSNPSDCYWRSAGAAH